MLRLNGMRNPNKPVPQEKLIQFAAESGFDSSRILYWNSREAKTDFIRRHDYVPDIYVYNRDGHWVPYRNKEACNAEGFNLARELCAFEFEAPDTTDRLDYYLSGLRRADGRGLQVDLPARAKYTLLITWARYLGKVTRDHIIPWQQALQSQTGCEVDYYYVCFDRVAKD